jgi:hypothetical protein
VEDVDSFPEAMDPVTPHNHAQTGRFQFIIGDPSKTYTLTNYKQTNKVTNKQTKKKQKTKKQASKQTLIQKNNNQ